MLVVKIIFPTFGRVCKPMTTTTDEKGAGTRVEEKDLKGFRRSQHSRIGKEWMMVLGL